MKNFFTKKSRAQGILEVVIAIYISVVGILSIVNLVISNIKVERFNHNMLIASNLAKEGVEIVRSVRDTNWISLQSFSKDLLPPPGSTISQQRTFIIENMYMDTINNGYSITYVGLSWNNCISQSYSINGNPAPCKLRLINIPGEESKKMYSHPATYSSIDEENTNFYRIIFINEICYPMSSDFTLGVETIKTAANETCESSGLKSIGLQVVSQVGWYDNGMKVTKVEEKMYDWR